MAIVLPFHLQIKAAGLPDPVPEYRFHETRRWRFDWAWPAYMVCVEREGASWQGGRHTRGKGFRDDAIKYNEAAIAGWLLIRFTVDMETRGQALDMVERALKARGWQGDGSGAKPA